MCTRKAIKPKPKRKQAMKTFLNLKTSQVRETVDQFDKVEGRTAKEYRAYVRSMIAEYRMAGMNVYSSSRCCANWK